MAESRRYALIADLNAEWARLSESSDATVSGWAEKHPALQQCRTLPDVLIAIRANPDPALTALLTEAGADQTSQQTLACRVVLQALLGKVVRLGQARPGVDELVSALWCRIRTYPLARRPTKIAANLALDARKDALAIMGGHHRESAVGSFSEPGWDSRLGHRACGEVGGDDPAEEALVEARRVITAAQEIGLIDAATFSVLATVYLDGANSRSAAESHDTTPAMVRYRCSTALRRMSRHSVAISAAA